MAMERVIRRPVLCVSVLAFVALALCQAFIALSPGFVAPPAAAGREGARSNAVAQLGSQVATAASPAEQHEAVAAVAAAPERKVAATASAAAISFAYALAAEPAFAAD